MKERGKNNWSPIPRRPIGGAHKQEHSFLVDCAETTSVYITGHAVLIVVFLNSGL